MVSFIDQLNIGYAYFEGFTDSTKKQGNTINKTIFGPREGIYSCSKVFLYQKKSKAVLARGPHRIK